MRVKSLLILLSVTALGAYAVGRHSSPAKNAPVAPVAQSQSLVAKPLAFVAPVSPPIATTATPSATNNPAPTHKTQPEKVATAHAPEKPAPPEIKRKTEIALTAAAIAAILIKASRDQYHATGRPCACPDHPCATAERAALGAPILGRAARHRFAILAM